MYGELLTLPTLIKEVKDQESYYQALSGSQLVVTLLDGGLNLVARGTGFQWNENYQKMPIPEWGQRHIIEIVTGQMNVGQASIQSMFFMNLNDTLPTFKNLVSRRELEIIVQIADHEDPALAGLVLDVFQGVHIQGQSGNFSAQSLYLRNANMMYRKRLTGLEWARLSNDTNYPAEPEIAVAPIGIGNDKNKT